jgi:hypothetical protein
MDSEGQSMVMLGPYFQLFAPYYNLLGDLLLAMSLLLFPGLFSVTFLLF